MDNFSLEEELRSLSQFEQWLEQQPFADDAQIGLALEPQLCPLALFLRDKTGVKASVSPEVVSLQGREIAFHSTLSERFVELIDQGRREGQPITLAEAKRILQESREKSGTYAESA